MSVDLYRNRDLILAQERRLAGRVAGEVVDRPVLSMWMIMIPIFFVFYYFQFKRYKNGLRSFSKNFLVTRERVLEAVCEASRAHTGVDIDRLVTVSDSPAQVKGEYRLWVEALADHFRVLIAVDGADYGALVRGGYRGRAAYQRALGALGRAEDAYHRALAAHLPGDPETISRVVDSMRDSVKAQRRGLVEEIFP